MRRGISGDNTEEIRRRIAERRKSSYAMKRLSIQLFVITIVILCVWCGFLLMKIMVLDETLQNVTNQLNDMNELLREQQLQLDEVNSAAGMGQNTLKSNESGQQTLATDEVAETALDAEHKVYLTFDDGPSIYTEEILDILDQYGVKATFFVVGKSGDLPKERMEMIVNRGHALGMHSYSHDYSTLYDSLENFTSDFWEMQDYIFEATGIQSTLYRFPGGSSNTVSEIHMQEFIDFLEEQGVTYYDWNISSGDGGSIMLSVEELVENCTKSIPNWKTSIVLLHDSADKRSTVDALPQIIETILAMEDTVILPITEETRPVQHTNALATNQGNE